MYGYGFLGWSFTDRREILHGSSAYLGQVFYLGDSPRDGRILGVKAPWRDTILAEAFV